MATILHKAHFADITLQLLKKGEDKLVLSDQHKNAVLLLGNTGSGKSTLVQWLAGDDSKLIAKELRKGSGEFLIEDNNKRIGNATITSKTVFPELVLDPKTQTAFYDTPGFSDTRSTSFDVATSYFIKKVADHVEAVKLLFIVGYPAVRRGVDRQDFLKLLRHSTELIQNVDKFSSSIALIVTKVDNQYVKIGKTLTLLSDENIIEAIADFLIEIQQSLEDRLNEANISEKDKIFYRNSIKFVKILLSQNDEKVYTHIGIFRRPDEAGPLSKLVMFQEGKNHIKLILSQYLSFTLKNEHDFGYTISDRSKNDINELVEKINDNVWENLGVIVEKVEVFYTDLVEKMRVKVRSFVTNSSEIVEANQNDAETFKFLLETAYNVSSDLVDKSSNATTNDLEDLVTKSLTILNIETCKENLENISNQGDLYNFLQVVITDTKLATRSWDVLFQNLKTSISHSKLSIQIESESVGEKIQFMVDFTASKFLEELLQIYQKKISEFEIQILPSWLNKEYAALMSLSKEIDGATNVQEFAIKISKNLPKLNVETSKIARVTLALFHYGKYWTFLQTLSGKNFLPNSINELHIQFDEVDKFIYDSMIWYTFLDNLYASLSSYDIQRDTTRYNVASLEDWSTVGKAQGIQITRDNIKQFMNKLKQFKLTETGLINEMQITDSQLRELNQLLSLTLKDKFAFYCPQPDKLIIKGDYVKFSDLIDTNWKIKNMCSSSLKLDSVTILATNTVFIDRDINGRGDSLKLTVIAPEWQILGDRVIFLDGAPAHAHYLLKAQPGVAPGSKGHDGLPGLPGGPGGSFFGFGQQIANSQFNLTISVNGGKGGLGQNGGDGQKGQVGYSLNTNYLDVYCHENLCACKPQHCGATDNNFNKRKKRNLYVLGGLALAVVVSAKIVQDHIDNNRCLYRIFGGAGEAGGLGGNGGAGGNGGNPGEIVIFGLNNTNRIQIHSQVGMQGEMGLGGIGAEYGNEGEDVIVQCNYMFNSVSSKLVDIYEKEPITGRVKNGTDGFNVVDRMVPEADHTMSLNLQYIMNEYKSYLRENLNNSNYRFKRHSAIKFLGFLNSDSDTTNIYYTFGLFDELCSLDEQSHRLNKDDLHSFYQSLLKRIDDYSNKMEDENQNKKVLDYMAAATLGKISNLKSSPSTNLIVDVDEYLNLVEKNILMLKDIQNKQNKIEFIEQTFNVDYGSQIDHKMAEARSIVQTHIIPEIEYISFQIENRIHELIKQILAHQQQNRFQRAQLIKTQRELQKELAIKQVFQVLEVTLTVFAVCLLGPAGGAAVGAGRRAAAVIVASSKNAFQLSSLLSLDNSYDQAKIETVRSVIKEKENAFYDLKAHENRIYTTLAPLLQHATKILKITSNKIDQVQSPLDLDLIKWRVQSKLKDIQLEIRKLTSNFTVEDDLMRCVEKFEDIITTLVNIYDRVQHFQEQKNFANYIAKINLPTDQLEVTDPNLSTLLNKLDIMVRSNLVARQYQSIIAALKQLVFPYAQFYLDVDSLELNPKTSVQKLASRAVKQIEKIALKVREHRTTIWSYDKYSHSGWFDSDHISTKPFFTWTNSQYKYTISKLLSGQEIVIKADVRMSEHNDKDAMKFNLIEFAFKSPNATIQFELERKLKSFKVEATHLGNSYYRYNSQYYVISSESQTMQYSFEKDATGVPIHANAVYSKIVDGNLMLSPYAMWRVRLVNLTDTVSFRELASLFDDKVYLELIGRGSYVERSAIGLNVDDYYKVDDTLDSNNEEIGFPFYSDQHVDVNRTKRFVENLETITSQDNITFPPVTSSPTQASSFVDKIKHFYVKTVDKLFDSQSTFLVDSSRIDRNSKTSYNNYVTNFLDINESLVFGQLIVGLLWGKNNSLANQLSYQSPAQEQSVRIDNLSQQILPILKQKDFFEEH